MDIVETHDLMGVLRNLPPLLTATNVATLNWDSLRSTNVYEVQRSYGTNASDTIAGLPWSFAKTFFGTSETEMPMPVLLITFPVAARLRMAQDQPSTMPTSLAFSMTFPVTAASASTWMPKPPPVSLL